MRASWLFALFLALLLGLTAVAAARYFGLFNSKPPVVAQTLKAPEPLKVLVAKTNLFAPYLITELDVHLRPLRPEEKDHYDKNKASYVPPTVGAARMRVLAKDVDADQPLLKEHLAPAKIPPGLGQKIANGYRAVHLSVPKNLAAGGMIRVGEYVDLFLTTTISTTGTDLAATSRTACIARDLRVILKRDMLYDVLAPVPDVITFHLEANPYRAALIEYAKEKGQLTMVPTPNPPEDRKVPDGTPVTYSDPDSKEYKVEDERVKAVLRGDRSVGDGDLERIFGLGPLPPQATKVTVEHYIGNTKKGVTEITGIPVAHQALKTPIGFNPDQPGYGYQFTSSPSSTEAGVTPTVPKKAAPKSNISATKKKN